MVFFELVTNDVNWTRTELKSLEIGETLAVQSYNCLFNRWSTGSSQKFVANQPASTVSGTTLPARVCFPKCNNFMINYSKLNSSLHVLLYYVPNALILVFLENENFSNILFQLLY